MKLKSRYTDSYSELRLDVKKADLRSVCLSHGTLQRAIKAHKSSRLGLDREQGRPTAQSALCSPQPSGYKEFRDPCISDPLCYFWVTGRDMNVLLPTKTYIDDSQEPKAHKNHSSFFHRNHFSFKFSCNINAFHANALFIYHFSLSSEKIIIIIVIIMQ